MKRKNLKLILDQEVNKYKNKPCSELVKITNSEIYEITIEQNHCQVEVQVVERNENYLNISIAIDDKSFLCSIFPVTTNFIVNM